MATKKQKKVKNQNPFVSPDFLHDTLRNAQCAVDFIAEVSVEFGKGESLSENASAGLFYILQGVSDALEFATHDLDSNYVRREKTERGGSQ